MKKIEKKTYSELYQVVAQYAAALRKLGIKQGDRVVGMFVCFDLSALCVGCPQIISE